MSFASRFTTAPDGLRLHHREYGGGPEARTAVVCLPGLARTAADFDALAGALASPARRVLALDYRGRGRSERDPNPDNYDVMVETADIQAVLTAAGVDAAVVVGTSRGGLHAMLLAVLRPTLLRGVVLNDIGPVIEPLGLARIRGYVGKLPEPKSWTDAVDLLKRIAGAQFTGLAEADWRAYAETTFEQRDGRFVPLYDPALMKGLEALDLDKIPVLWPQFEALRAVPVLAVRGENSDLLSRATLDAMAARHPVFASLTVPGQGHAPLLGDKPTIDRIAAFVNACEADEADAARRGLRLLG